MNSARFHDLDDDRGFTLPELLISISVMGIIVGAITAALLAMLTNQNSVSDRLSNSRGGETLTEWFQSDVASAQGAAISTAAGAWACSGAAPSGSNLLQLPMVDLTGGGQSRVVAYRITTSATDGPYQLTRTECVSGGVASTRVFVRSIAAQGDVVITPTPNTAPYGRVQLTVTVTGANTTSQVTFTASASPRTPGVPGGADVQGRTSGTDNLIDIGDTITLTYTAAMDLSTIVTGVNGGWTGTSRSTTVTVSVGAGTNNDFLSFANGVNLGTVDLGSPNWATAPATATATIAATTTNGRTVVTITLTQTPNLAGNGEDGEGGPGPGGSVLTATLLKWTPSASAKNLNGTATATTAVFESGVADVDF